MQAGSPLNGLVTPIPGAPPGAPQAMNEFQKGTTDFRGSPPKPCQLENHCDRRTARPPCAERSL